MMCLYFESLCRRKRTFIPQKSWVGQRFGMPKTIGRTTVDVDGYDCYKKHVWVNNENYFHPLQIVQTFCTIRSLTVIQQYAISNVLYCSYQVNHSLGFASLWEIGVSPNHLRTF